MPKLHLPSDDYSHDAHMTKTLLAALVVVVFSARLNAGVGAHPKGGV